MKRESVKKEQAGEQIFEYIAYNLRRSIITMTSVAGSGHPTSALSAADIVATLFFYAMRIDLQDYNNPNNDRFILSNGHGSMLIYSLLHLTGYDLPMDEIKTFRQLHSNLYNSSTPEVILTGCKILEIMHRQKK